MVKNTRPIYDVQDLITIPILNSGAKYYVERAPVMFFSFLTWYMTSKKFNYDLMLVLPLKYHAYASTTISNAQNLHMQHVINLVLYEKNLIEDSCVCSRNHSKLLSLTRFNNIIRNMFSFLNHG